jgi:ParB family chromosome partitioning protein
MAVAPIKKGLGRGLSSLMGEGLPVATALALAPALRTNMPAPEPLAQPVAATSPNKLPVDALSPGKYQPRRHFDTEALTELADSIEKHGLMQPIVVRAIKEGRYEIIAGERRWRAAKLASMREVPVIIREVDDAEALELALIENIQRADLNPLEEAAGYQRLMDEFGYTQEKLAPVVGKSRSHIANLLRLLKLPDSVKHRIDTGQLTMGHARAILMAKDPEELARKIIEIGMSVRQAEDFAKGIEPGQGAGANGAASNPSARPSGNGKTHHRAGVTKNEDVLQLEAMLAENLGLRVSINTSGAQAGEVVIGYDSLTQLDEILRRLGGSI